MQPAPLLVPFRFLLAILALGAPLGAQWETSQGGNSRRDGLVATLGPVAPHAGWSDARTTQFAVQPVVGEGKVFYTRVTDWQSASGNELVAANLRTGEILWTASLPISNGLYNTPVAVRDGKVYATRTHWALVNELLYALDASTGAPVWTSQNMIQAHFHTSPAFLDNGDLIVNGEYVQSLGWRMLRIDHLTGATVWIRPPPEGANANLAGGAVFQDRFYMVHELPGLHEVVRIDATNGMRLYGSAPEGDGFSSQTNGNLMIGPEGTLYWPYGADQTGGAELIALTDTGSALVEKWRVPVRALWASSLAIGPDGSVHSYSRAGEIVRLDPETGATTASSPPFSIDFRALTRMTIDREGHVFALLQGYGATPAELHALDPELRPLWSVVLGLSPQAGPSLSDDGRLIVSTAGEVLRTFRLPHLRENEDPPCVARAEVRFRNGTGVNPVCLASADRPLLGANWSMEIDASVRPGVVLAGVIFASSASGGAFLAAGEVLIDLASQQHLRFTCLTVGGIEAASFPVPRDVSLCGRALSGQAFLAGGGQLTLCNALDLVLGD